MLYESFFHEQETSHVRVTSTFSCYSSTEKKLLMCESRAHSLVTLPRRRNFSCTSQVAEPDSRMNCTILLLLFHEQDTSHVRVMTAERPLLSCHSYSFRFVFTAGGKPSTWFPPGGLVEQSRLHRTKLESRPHDATGPAPQQPGAT